MEGKSDVSYLSSFINALYFTTNGLDISEGKICKDLKVELNKVIRNCRDEGFSWDEIGYRLIQVIGDALYDAEINEGFDEDEEE